MSNVFGKRTSAQVPTAFDRYGMRVNKTKPEKTDGAVDKALAWMAYYCAVFCAMVMFSPDVAMAAICALPSGVC
jgi:hypothetical protein